MAKETLKFKSALYLVAVILGLVVTAWAVDSHFTPREIFKIAMQGMQKEFKSLQQDRLLSKAYRDIQFWTQQEASLRSQLAYAAHGTSLYDEIRRQINEAVNQKCAAQRHLEQLKSK